jgi:hypothetical protein
MDKQFWMAMRENKYALPEGCDLVSLTEELFERHLGEDLTRRYLALPFVDPGQVVFGIVNAAAARDAGGGWADPVVVGGAVRASLREAWLQLSYRLGRTAANGTGAARSSPAFG